ncbi:hypothetical protein GW17_00058042 [Ensete ventricosum]|nr:hypothetical protein GW17_00058042 [Ensete ventricosum]
MEAVYFKACGLHKFKRPHRSDRGNDNERCMMICFDDFLEKLVLPVKHSAEAESFSNRPSNIFPYRPVEEALGPTPLFGVGASVPQHVPTDAGLPTLTPDRNWRLFNDPGLAPPIVNPPPLTVSTEAFIGLSHQVQVLTRMIQAIIPHIPQLV